MQKPVNHRDKLGGVTWIRTKSKRLQVLLAANGLEVDQYFTQPLHGVDNLSAAVPIADFFIQQGDNTCVLVHRDGDGMLQEERTWWVANEETKLPERAFALRV